jgi:hypothetical protein
MTATRFSGSPLWKGGARKAKISFVLSGPELKTALL